MVLYPVHLPKRALLARHVEEPAPSRPTARDVLTGMYARLDEDLDSLSQ